MRLKPALIGILIGSALFALSVLSDGSVGLANKSGEDRMLIYLGQFLLIFLAYFVQVAFHEAGHLLFGWLTGYKFVSYRIGRWMLVRQQGRFRLKRFHIPGTGGQCLMSPPEVGAEHCPYLLYGLGGIILNLLTMLLALAWVVLFPVSYPVDFFLYLIIFFGLLQAIISSIPKKISAIPNDASNIRSLNSDPLARKALYLQLKVNALQTDGVRLKDMPEEWFQVPADLNLGNSLDASLKFLEAARWMDRLDFAKAEECYRTISLSFDKLMPLYRMEVKSELLFMEMIGQCRKEEIERMCTPELQRYVGTCSRFMMGKMRILYADALYVDKDMDKAKKLLTDAIVKSDSYPQKGDTDSEIEIMQYLEKRYAEAGETNSILEK